MNDYKMKNNVSEQKKKELSIVDIGNYCLLTEKYKSYLESQGIENNSEKNTFFIEECSKLISEQLNLMDECQKMLYQYGTDVEKTDTLKQVRDAFLEGVIMMQEVLNTFNLIVGE